MAFSPKRTGEKKKEENNTKEGYTLLSFLAKVFFFLFFFLWGKGTTNPKRRGKNLRRGEKTESSGKAHRSSNRSTKINTVQPDVLKKKGKTKRGGENKKKGKVPWGFIISLNNRKHTTSLLGRRADRKKR